VSGLSPSSGAASGGTQVTITGKDLAGATVVEFGGVDAEIVSVGGGEIVARAPGGIVGEVNVIVTTAYGASATSGKDLFTYRPSIKSITPSSGPTAGGTEVKVIGSGFVAGGEGVVFAFGSTRASAVNCTSSTECIVTSPKHNGANTVEIGVTVRGESNANTSAADFTFTG
jgi:hypothetical protein